MARNGSGSGRMLRGGTANFLALLLSGAILTGCTPAAPQPTPTPTSTAIFSSEDEALAAATDVYQRYNAVIDKSLATSGKDLSGIQGLVTKEHLKELEKPGTIDSNGWHTDGVSTFSVISVASFESSPSAAQVSINLCRDLSKVRVINSSGTDVTPDSWVELVPLTVSFTTSESHPPSLLVSAVELWSEQEPC